MNRFKRILVIFSFAIGVIAVIVIIWLLFFQPFFSNEPTVNTNVNSSTAGPLPNANVNRPSGLVNQPLATGPTVLPKPSEVANGDITLTTSVSTSTSVAPIVGPDGKQLLYYDDLTDKFMRVNPATGAVTELVSKKFPDVQNITWAPDSMKAVLEFPDETKVIYDFASSKQYSLPKDAQEFSFSSDSARLAYEFVGTGQDEQYLITSNLDGSSTKALTKLGDEAANIQVAWSPTDEVVAFFKKGADSNNQEIILLGQNQENFKSIAAPGRGFDGKWTPDGSKLLYTVYSETTNWNPELYLVHAKGQAIGQGTTSLGLQTFVDKCAFNSRGTHAYCAVPDVLDRGSGLYPEFASNVRDTIYSINLETGESSPIAQPVTGSLQRFTVYNIVLSKDEQELYFVDGSTHRLQKIRLK